MDPVLRWKPARAAVAVGLAGGAFLALAAGWFLLLWLFSPLVFLGMLAAAIAAPVAAVAVWRGRWSQGSSGTAQRLAISVVALTLVGYALVAALRAVGETRVRELGVPTESQAGAWLVLVAAALVCLAVLATAAPRWFSRAATIAIAAATSSGAVAALAVAATVDAGATCADARVDRTTWRAALNDDRSATVTDGERIAAAIVHCDLLNGRSRAEVRRLLGRPYPEGENRWTWEVGWVNDGIGPGDGQQLIVHFDRTGRVTRSTLAYPPD